MPQRPWWQQQGASQDVPNDGDTIRYDLIEDRWKPQNPSDASGLMRVIRSPLVTPANASQLRDGVSFGPLLPAGTILFDMSVFTPVLWDGTAAADVGLLQGEDVAGMGALVDSGAYGLNAPVQADSVKMNGSVTSYWGLFSYYLGYSGPTRLTGDGQLYLIVSTDGTTNGDIVECTVGSLFVAVTVCSF
jgi:hypothetical protein